MAAVALAVRLATWLFPHEFRLGWILDELAPHLPLELDFEHEARNLRRCADFFTAGGGAPSGLCLSVTTPEVLPSLSSARVLTMSFEDGVSVVEGASIEALGLRVADVTRLLSETFCAQIFAGGFVHADPHPGNVLVRPRPGAPHQPEIVLLDHGLYRELPRPFVELYARLWHAVLLADADGIRRVSFALGVGDYYPLFAAMLTGKPWADIVDGGAGADRLREKGTAEDKAAIRGYAQQYAKGIAIVLERVPPPMLLLLKANDCLRHAERRLTGSAAGMQSMLVTLRHCLQTVLGASAVEAPAAAEQATADGGGGNRALLATWARERWRRVQLGLAVLLMQVLSSARATPLLEKMVWKLAASSA